MKKGELKRLRELELDLNAAVELLNEAVELLRDVSGSYWVKNKQTHLSIGKIMDNVEKFLEKVGEGDLRRAKAFWGDSTRAMEELFPEKAGEDED
jgi:hypothetical protein